MVDDNTVWPWQDARHAARAGSASEVMTSAATTVINFTYKLYQQQRRSISCGITKYRCGVFYIFIAFLTPNPECLSPGGRFVVIVIMAAFRTQSTCSVCTWH